MVFTFKQLSMSCVLNAVVFVITPNLEGNYCRTAILLNRMSETNLAKVPSMLFDLLILISSSDSRSPTDVICGTVCCPHDVQSLWYAEAILQ